MRRDRELLCVLGLGAAVLCSGCYPMVVNEFPDARSLRSGAWGGTFMAGPADFTGSDTAAGQAGTQTWGLSNFQEEPTLRRGLPAGLELGLGATLLPLLPALPSTVALDEKWQFLGRQDPSALALAADAQEQAYLWPNADGGGGGYTSYTFALIAQKRLAEHWVLNAGLRPGYFFDSSYTSQYPDEYSPPSFGGAPSFPIEPQGWFGDWMLGLSVPLSDHFEWRFQLIQRLMLPDRRAYAGQYEYFGPPGPPPPPATYTYAPVWTFLAGLAWSGTPPRPKGTLVIHAEAGELYVDGSDEGGLWSVGSLTLKEPGGLHHLLLVAPGGVVERDVEVSPGQTRMVSLLLNVPRAGSAPLPTAPEPPRADQLPVLP